jgi:hypothetical protein
LADFSAMVHLRRAVERFVFAMVFALPAIVPAHAATTYSWTGTSSNAWSNPSNWNPVGVPANGDSVAFPSGAANLTNTNDLTGLSLLNMAFNGSGYTVGGNGVVLTNSLTSVSTNNVVNLPIDVQANAVTLGGVRMNGALSGTGAITLNNSLLLAGAHSYSGTLHPHNWSLYLNGASLPDATIDPFEGSSFYNGYVYGNGTVGTLTDVSGRLYLYPGANDGGSGPGIINTGNLTFVSVSLWPS